MIAVNKTDYEKMEFCVGKAPAMENSKIISESNNNMIFCEEGVVLKDSTITFVGDGNLVYLSSNHHYYSLNLRIYKNSCFFMDENNYMNGQLSVLVQEHQNVLIGKDGAFSYGIHIMTSDAHLIYSIDTMCRINESNSICIGDHVWVGQYASIFKGTVIGSGSIIGGTSTITGKRCPSNTIWVGNPAKQIKENVFWDKSCPNLYELSETKAVAFYHKEPLFFYYDERRILDFNSIDKRLIACEDNIIKRVDIIDSVRGETGKNRFFISS